MGPKAIDILKNINGIDTSLANRIKDNMFVFEDLLNLDTEYIMKIIQGVESADVAMKKCNWRANQKSNRWKCLKGLKIDLMKSEMLNEKLKLKDIEARQRRMLAVAQKMIEDGVIERENT